ncbi:MAG TPA: ABC transporter permease [Bryobacteraceae bacterium]|nr:ABC transporter permease [Bryobacteraceae bacterium]
MTNLWKDVRYSLRVFVAAPGFTAVIVLSLALAIGANVAIFAMVNAFLLRPMPVDHPGRLIAIYVNAPNSGANVEGFSYPQLLDFRKQDTGLSAIVGSAGLPLSITEGDKPELIWGEIVTGDYFSGLGVHPMIGRGFLPDEDRAPGAKPVCVINYGFWQRRFHADPSIEGKTIRIEGHAFTIVGVAPRGFLGTGLFHFVPDVWVPVMMQQTVAASFGNYLEGRGNRWIDIRARLKPGVTRRQAEAALNVVARALGREYPQSDGGLTVHTIPAGSRTLPVLVANGMIPGVTAIMIAVVVLVLLIACANVANLMLARGATRARELAIRLSVGATRARIVRQLLTESLVLALAGGLGGILFSLWFNDLLLRYYPSLDFQTMDLADTARADPKIFAFALLVSIAAAAIFGLVPALRASSVHQASAMKGDLDGTRAGRSGNVLVMAQVALSLVLLIVGGLFVRSMQFANNVDLGFYRTGITMFSVNLDLQGYDPRRATIFEHTAIDRLRTIPGVDSAAIGFPLPLDAYNGPIAIYPEGWTPRSDREENIAGHSRVSAGYFETMGTRIIAGRAIDDRDTASSTPVAVVNEAMARRYWQSPGQALGRKFSESKSGPQLEIVGVAANGKYFFMGEPAYSYVFTALAQDHSGQITALLRSKQDIATLMPMVRREMTALDPSLPLFGVRTMPQFLFRTTSIYETGASLVGTFAVMALLLAGVGIFGVLHFAVACRTREIGIRMALGARAGQVLRMILQRSLAWVAAGIVIGIGLALSARGITGQMVAGVSGSDPSTFLAALAVFLLLILLAILIPARRAARVDPLQALRHE